MKHKPSRFQNGVLDPPDAFHWRPRSELNRDSLVCSQSPCRLARDQDFGGGGGTRTRIFGTVGFRKPASCGKLQTHSRFVVSSRQPVHPEPPTVFDLCRSYYAYRIQVLRCAPVCATPPCEILVFLQGLEPRLFSVLSTAPLPIGLKKHGAFGRSRTYRFSGLNRTSLPFLYKRKSRGLPKNFWYAERDSNPQAPRSKRGEFAISLSALNSLETRGLWCP